MVVRNERQPTEERKNATACNFFLESADCGVAHPVVARCFIVLEITWPTGAELSVSYVMPLVIKVNRRNEIVEVGERLKKMAENKSGRGHPTSPTLRPRVLTPRDHFVHRGGERKRIMQ